MCVKLSRLSEVLWVAVVMVWSKVKNGMKAMGFCISLDALSRGAKARQVALGNTNSGPF
jgi:hypothetical protein